MRFPERSVPRGGNILELSQTVMCGYFTLILEVAFPEALSMKGLAGAVNGRRREVRRDGRRDRGR